VFCEGTTETGIPLNDEKLGMLYVNHIISSSHVMNEMDKIIAREFLVFLGSLLVGFGVCGPVLSIAFGSKAVEFYVGLFGHCFDPLTWAVGFAPYVLFQLCRATVWTIKTIRAK